MLVGVCKLELFIPASGSLKSKRFVLKSLKTRIRNKFNVSVAEVGENEKWQRTTLGIAAVCNERKIIDSMFNQIMNMIYMDGRIEVVDQFIDIY
ncbi:DUF503 domain-containing protein [candidate division KSB1 bacterium]|nr:DUF503 domain-containing protein [candidate division KSB1 bacterium]